jgi:hypothetical protein
MTIRLLAKANRRLAGDRVGVVAGLRHEMNPKHALAVFVVGTARESIGGN